MIPKSCADHGSQIVVRLVAIESDDQPTRGLVAIRYSQDDFDIVGIMTAWSGRDDDRRNVQ